MQNNFRYLWSVHVPSASGRQPEAQQWSIDVFPGAPLGAKSFAKLYQRSSCNVQHLLGYWRVVDRGHCADCEGDFVQASRLKREKHQDAVSLHRLSDLQSYGIICKLYPNLSQNKNIHKNKLNFIL